MLARERRLLLRPPTNIYVLTGPKLGSTQEGEGTRPEASGAGQVCWQPAWLLCVVVHRSFLARRNVDFETAPAFLPNEEALSGRIGAECAGTGQQ